MGQWSNRKKAVQPWENHFHVINPKVYHVIPVLSSNFEIFFTNASAVPLQRENVQKKTRQKQTFALQLATKPLY